MNEDLSWTEAVVALLFLGSIAAVICIVIWQLFSTYKARMLVARDDAYRKLAEEAVAGQQRTAAELAALTAELTRLRTQTDELERVLKTVE